MANTTRRWFLGGADPEEVAIEALLRECGESVQYAVDPDGQRVHPGNAYKAVFPAAEPGVTVYLVECGGADEPVGAIRIDHHRPGDPGYGRPPEEFLQASSLGQTISELAKLGNQFNWPLRGGGRRMWTQCHPTGAVIPSVGDLIFMASCADPFGDLKPRRDHRWHIVRDASVSKFTETGTRLSNDERRYESVGSVTVTEKKILAAVPEGLVLAAAADHCLEAAYRGRCPGVDPDKLMQWRAESRATFQRRPVADVLADVERARDTLRVAPRVADSGVADLRGQTVPELPEAACRDGVPYLATVADRAGRQKVTLGAASPELVRSFMAGDIIPGLTGYYGDPARGFAGGYMS